MFKHFKHVKPGIHNGDFMLYIAEIFAIAVQEGNRIELCNMLIDPDFMKKPFTKLGEFASEEVGIKIEDY